MLKQNHTKQDEIEALKRIQLARNWVNLFAPPEAKIILKENISEIVIGLPVGLDGGETELSGEVRGFVEKLKKEFALPIHLENEVYSTAQARTMQGAAEDKIDAASAALILQTFLDRRRAAE